MGLDFSHGDAHWSYRGFNNFRVKLIRSIGIEANDSIFDSTNYDYYSTCCFKAQFSPIHPLITHSDCDGYLTIKEMKQIIPVLNKILSLWNQKDYDTQMGIELIKGMKQAIKRKEQLKFD